MIQQSIKSTSTLQGLKWCPHHQQTNVVQAHQDSREAGTTKPVPPQETEKIWLVLRSSQGSTAASLRASRRIASLPGMATARPPTARHYRG